MPETGAGGAAVGVVPRPADWSGGGVPGLEVGPTSRAEMEVSMRDCLKRLLRPYVPRGLSPGNAR